MQDKKNWLCNTAATKAKQDCVKSSERYTKRAPCQLVFTYSQVNI